MLTNKIYQGDALEVLKTFPDECIDMCITSPPYWGLRDYGVESQIGLEETPEMFINNLCDIFDEVKRVLTSRGSCWVNLGDSYCRNPNQQDPQKGINSKYEYNYQHKKNYSDAYRPKSLVQIPSRFAIEMTNRGWILRNEIIWYKPTCMPASVKDRYTVDFEKLFFFTKESKYYFKQQVEDTKAKTIEPRMAEEKRDVYSAKHKGTHLASSSRTMTRNKRTVWSINPASFKDAHFAVYPIELIESPIDAGCPDDGVVLDPFFGSGTTAEVALSQDKNWVGIELNQEYIDIAEKRLKKPKIAHKTRIKSKKFWG